MLLDCLDISKDNLVKTFQNWGNVYNIEFTIKVTNVTFDGLKNVFRFTALYYQFYGHSIPTLWISNKKFFLVSSAVNGNKNYQKVFGFEIGTKYQVSIKQYLDGGQYWYEFIVDGKSQVKIVNTQPKSFPEVKLYASDPFGDPFTSKFGNVCNLNIREGT